MNNYSNFIKTWNEIISRLKQKMLDFENSMDGDVIFTDIILDIDSIRTKVDSNNIFFEFDVGLPFKEYYLDADTNLPIANNIYKLLIQDNDVILLHDELGGNFYSSWNIDEINEINLIKAIFKDMFILDPMWLIDETLDGNDMNMVINKNYFTINLLDDTQLLTYYERYKIDVFLPETTKNIFLF